MVTLTLKVPESLAARLEVAARQRGAGKSALVREAIVAYLGQAPESRAGSFLDAARDLPGVVSGPANLSTSPTHLKGYGR